MTLTPGERLRASIAGPLPVASPSAGGADGGTGDDYDPGAHTIAEVLAYVQEHPGEWAAVLTAEEDGKARVTLLDALAVVDPEDEG